MGEGEGEGKGEEQNGTGNKGEIEQHQQTEEFSGEHMLSNNHSPAGTLTLSIPCQHNSHYCILLCPPTSRRGVLAFLHYSPSSHSPTHQSASLPGSLPGSLPHQSASLALSLPPSPERPARFPLPPRGQPRGRESTPPAPAQTHSRQPLDPPGRRGGEGRDGGSGGWRERGMEADEYGWETTERSEGGIKGGSEGQMEGGRDQGR